MKILKSILLPAIILAIAFSSASAQREAVDKIVAVVGNEVILASELAAQIQMVALQTGRRPRTEAELKEMQEQILESMISDKLFLIEAKKDTSITVRDDEVEQALDEHIARIMGNFDSEEAFLQALAQEGMTVRDLRRQYRDDVENSTMRQRLVQKKLYSITVSRHEVEQFYNEFQDSIPDQPEAVKLGHILLTYKPSKAVEDSVKALATSLRQQALDGADFATLSARHSSYGAADNGGDLGFISRDDVVDDFARAAFALQVGDISGVIRTQFGYHVIKCEGKREERLHLRHILLAAEPSLADSVAVTNVADSLLGELRSDANFAEMAKAFSEDDETRVTGGELGWFATNQLPPEFADAVSGWTTPGDYRGPVKSRFGVHILKLLEHQPVKKYSLEDDFDRIKELARQSRTDEVVSEWVDQIRAKTYIDYRTDD